MQHEEFRHHPFWAAVEATGRKLGENPPATDPNDVARRLRAAVSYIVGFRRQFLAELFTPTMLKNAQATWTQLDNYVDQYVTTGNRAHLDQVSGPLDQIMNAVALWPSPISRSERLETASDSFRTLVDQVDVQTQAFRAMVREFEESIEKMRIERDNLAAELETLKAEIDTQTKTIRDEATKQNSVFNEAQTERSEKFQAFLEERRQDHSDALAAGEEALEVHQAQAAGILTEMEGTQGRLQQLVARIAGSRLGRKYGLYSFVQYLLAVLSIGLGIWLLVTAGRALVDSLATVTPGADVSWQWVALKFGVTATLVGAASIAVALGRGFLRTAATNKRVELELNALGPFLEDIRDDVETRKLRLAVADRLFGHAWEEEKTTRRQKRGVEHNRGMLQEILDLVKALRPGDTPQ